MKALVLLIALCLIQNVIAQTENKAGAKKSDKQRTYSEQEFQDQVKRRVKEEVKATLNKIKPQNVLNFSKQLLEKEEKLKLRELEVAKREEELELSKREVERKLQDFQSKQKNFITCVEDIEKEENDRIRHMVNIIGGMRPKNAAGMLEVQESGLAVKILAMLEPEKVSKIFNLMDKEISARLQKQYMTMKK